MTTMHTTPGTLWLMPNTLDLGAEAADLREVIPDAVLHRAAGLTHWVAEDARTTRAFLKRVAAVHPLAQTLQETDIRELPRPRKGAPNERIAPAVWAELLKPALEGRDLGLISEAGLPAVADPGSALVAAAHEFGIPVQPLSGPSSLLMALCASGLNGQSFAFVGYVPQEPAARAARLRELEVISRRQSQTQILIETPYRNQALFDALTASLAPATSLSISRGLTLPGGWSALHTAEQWRHHPPVELNGVPAVFCFLAR